MRWTMNSFFKEGKTSKPPTIKTQVLKRLKSPGSFLVITLIILIYLAFNELSIIWNRFTLAFVFINIMYLLYLLLKKLEEDLKNKLEKAGSHNSKDRKAITQLRFFKKMTLIIMVTHTLTFILWNIPVTRKISKAMFTSTASTGITSEQEIKQPAPNLLMPRTKKIQWGSIIHFPLRISRTNEI